MSWEIALGAASAVFGGFNAYDEYQANRVIRQDLDKIKKYLLGIDGKIGQVLDQNRQILTALDELSDQFRETLNENLLRERYSSIRDIRDNFLLLQGGRRFRLNSDAWREFSSAMTYIFEYEYRPSRTFDLILVAETALVITKERALPLVVRRIADKKNAILGLREDLESELETILVAVKSKLDNLKYISSHNLSTELEDIDSLVYRKQPNRTRIERYTVQECRWEEIGGFYFDRRRRVCRDVSRERQVPDHSFHRARQHFVKDIESRLFEINDILVRIEHLNGIIHLFSNYLRRVSKESKIVQSAQIEIDANFGMVFTNGGNVPEVLDMYFESNSGGKELSDHEKSNTQRETDDFDDFNDYIDGCGGDCDAVRGLDIQEDNPIFTAEKHVSDC